MGSQSVAAHPAGLGPQRAAPQPRLDVLHRTVRHDGGASHPSLSRPGGWRVFIDQCDGLRSGPSCRLRPLVGSWPGRLVLCACAAVLSARGDVDRGADDYRGGEGPLGVCPPNFPDPLLDAFIEAGVGAGHPTTPDYNGRQQEGFSRGQSTIRDGRRCSAAVAYLRPALAGRISESRRGRLLCRSCSRGSAPSASAIVRTMRRSICAPSAR